MLLPMGADQPLNADRCAALGVARLLDAVAATPSAIAAAVSAIMTAPAYRRAAQRMRDEIQRLPGPERAVELMEAIRV